MFFRTHHCQLNLRFNGYSDRSETALAGKHQISSRAPFHHQFARLADPESQIHAGVSTFFQQQVSDPAQLINRQIAVDPDALLREFARVALARQRLVIGG